MPYEYFEFVSTNETDDSATTGVYSCLQILIILEIIHSTRASKS